MQGIKEMLYIYIYIIYIYIYIYIYVYIIQGFLNGVDWWGTIWANWRKAA